jgi:hypothetical protein
MNTFTTARRSGILQLDHSQALGDKYRKTGNHNDRLQSTTEANYEYDDR